MENIHLAELRNKSIGAWMARIKEHPDSYWVWLGINQTYPAMSVPAKVYDRPNSYKTRIMSYRIPSYLENIIRQVEGFEESFINDVNTVMLLKVDMIDLGKGRYPKVRPYIVRLSSDCIRVFEKRCWEMTGSSDLTNKVWRFDHEAHAAFSPDREINAHAKYALRDGLKFVEDCDVFDKSNFDWSARQQTSMHEAFQYIITDPVSVYPRWCYKRVLFLRNLKGRLMG